MILLDCDTNFQLSSNKKKFLHLIKLESSYGLKGW